MVRAPRLILAIMVVSGVGIFALSFLPWLTFKLDETVLCFGYCDSSDIRGIEVKGVTDFGDGYVVAALGIFILVLTTLSGMTPSRRLLSLAIMGTAVGAMTIASFDIFNERDSTAYFAIEPSAALYGEAALAILVAICAAIWMGVLERPNRR